jgi:ABC-type glycerol-3-phosphate transport system permease component
MATWEKSSRIGQLLLLAIMIIIAIVMLFPFIYVIAVSFSSYKDAISNSLMIIPLHPTLQAYSWVLQNGGVTQGLLISIFSSVVGTAIGMFLTVTLAYGLSLQDIPGRKVALWMVILTLFITPSLITKFLVVRQLGMPDTLWALVIPSALSPFNVIVMRQFFMAIPQELIDSARLDGANDWHILWRIMLPLSKASLAAISLFYAVEIWNSFFEPTIYISNTALYPVSVILRMIVLQGSEPTQAVGVGQTPPPDLTVQMAVVVLATLPILLIYPFLQKYFTKGVLTGSIKG